STNVSDFNGLCLLQVTRKRVVELLDEDGDSLGPAPTMADRIIDRNLAGARSIVEKYLDRISDIAFVRIEIVLGELRIFLHGHLRTQRVDPWIGGDGIGVVLRGESPE